MYSRSSLQHLEECKYMNQQKLLDRARHVMPAAGIGNFDPDIIIREGRGSRVSRRDLIGLSRLQHRGSCARSGELGSG